MVYRAVLLVGATYHLSSIFINMGIFKVLGLGLAIIMLRFLVPEIFHALENTLLMFFDTLQLVLTKAQTGSNSAALVNLLPH